MTSFTKSKGNYNEENLIGSGGGKDTSACKMSDHSLYAVSGKFPETPNLTEWRQNE